MPRRQYAKPRFSLRVSLKLKRCIDGKLFRSLIIWSLSSPTSGAEGSQLRHPSFRELVAVACFIL